MNYVLWVNEILSKNEDICAKTAYRSEPWQRHGK
jgi:hypothetical protein